MKKSSSILRPLLYWLSGIVILVLLGQFVRFRLDLTEEKRYSLHPATIELLQNLDRPLEVEILLNGDQLPGGMRRLQKSIEETVRTFDAYAAEKITFSYFDPLSIENDSLQLEFIYTLAGYGINPTNLYFNQTAGQQTQRIFPGILVTDGEYESGALILKGEAGMSPDEKLNESIENLEYEISNAIRKLTQPQKTAIAMVIGHGELSEDEGFGLVEALDGEFEIFKVPLDQAKKVEDLSSFSMVLVVGPRGSYSERDLYLLDQYVLRGGNLIIAAEGADVDLNLAAGEGTVSIPLENELDRLLFRYGIRINKDLIQDLNLNYIPVMGGNFGNGEQMISLPWPYYFNAGVATPHPITKGLDQVNFRFASSLDTVKADGVQKTPLLFGSQYMRAIPAPARVAFSDMEKEPNLEDFSQSGLPLMYLLEGEFTSVFKNRFRPEEFSSTEFLESGKGKVIVLGDGSVFQSQFSLQSNEPLALGEDPFAQMTFANKQLLLNLTQYLQNPDGIISSRTRTLQIRPLDKVKIDSQQGFWQGINIGLPILMLSLLGGLLIVIRKNRYSKKA